jgi:APA family basic amino acid/polyamine antiporter
MPDAERPYRVFLPAFYIVVATAICIALLYTKLVRAVGVVIMLLGIPVYYLVKKKE